MPGNRRQKERVAAALTAPGFLKAATPQLVEDVLTAGDWTEVLGVVAATGIRYPEEVLPAVCRAAGIRFVP